MFIINCKNYNEIAGEKIIMLGKTAEKISKKYKIPIAIAPPHHLIPLIIKFKIIILAQHLDDKKIGSTTGFMVPDIAKKSKLAFLFSLTSSNFFFNPWTLAESKEISKYLKSRDKNYIDDKCIMVESN